MYSGIVSRSALTAKEIVSDSREALSSIKDEETTVLGEQATKLPMQRAKAID